MRAVTRTSVAAVGAMILLAAGPAAAGGSALLPWHDPRADARQVIRAVCDVPRSDAVVGFPVAGPTDGMLRVTTADDPTQPLPVFVADGWVSVRLPGKLLAGQPRLLVADWGRGLDWTGSPRLAAAPEDGDEYATFAYGDAWDFNEGDQDGIAHWGDRPTEYGEVAVRGGRLVLPVTGPDPYFIWGVMFGEPGDRPVERIDSGLYDRLSMRVRQSCLQAEWSIYLTDDEGRYYFHHFTVTGTQEQTVSLDLPGVFPECWDGRTFRALRIDPTNNAPGSLVEIDWVKLRRREAVAEAGPRLSRKQVRAREAVRAIKVEAPASVEAGKQFAARLLALGAGDRPAAGVPLTMELLGQDGSVERTTMTTGEDGEAVGRADAGTAAGERAWAIGVCDDLGAPSGPVRRGRADVAAGPLAGYVLEPARELVWVHEPAVDVAIWGVDEFGNRLPVDIAAPRWDVTGGAAVVTDRLRGEPTSATVICSPQPLTRHEIVLTDGAGNTGRLSLTTMALRDRPMTVSAGGYLVDADGGLFLPLGGFYANWPSALPDGDGKIGRALDLFPCGPTAYPHGYPWSPEVERQVADFLGLCRQQGVTALRLMLRNMDLVGRVDEEQLSAVLHLFDMARPLGIRFNVVLFEDYVKPPYVSQDVLEKVVLPHYESVDMGGLPAHRARFLIEKRLLERPASKYTDRDAIACQKDYLRGLLPHLASRDEVFCYELENEMVRPPIAWVNEMTEFIRSIDPRTPVLGNPGPHEWPEPWRWREADVDLFSYHPYSDGRADADHGAVVFMRSKWAAAAGKPFFTGEGGVNQSRWQADTGKAPAAFAARAVRDQIWLSLCCGACGAFMWTPEHVSEMAEFGKVHGALEAIGIDLLAMERRRPRTALAMPADASGNGGAYALGTRLLAGGVDFDTLPTDEAAGYEAQIATTDGAAHGFTGDLLQPGDGYELAYLGSRDLGTVLVYLRNVAGGTVNVGDGRPCYLRSPGPADAVVRVSGSATWGTVQAFDLDDGQEVPVMSDEGGRLLLLAPASTHDYVISLRR